MLGNWLGEGADAIVASASNRPQIVTLCGIQPGQTDINFSNQGLNVGDAKLLAFDVSKNGAIKNFKCPPLLSNALPFLPLDKRANTLLQPT